MRVRTIRDHYRYAPGENPFKSGSAGPVYEVPEREAKRLIARGYVESADEPVAESTKAVKVKRARKAR